MAGEDDKLRVEDVRIEDAWINDQRIAGRGGRLFARAWSGPGAAEAAPLVLLHDSLGSVELWRDFPERLCAATRRTVIAYDRLGFGRSDPHPGRLSLDFIADEAAAGFASLRAHFRLDRFVLFGHSVGGGMAVNIAARSGHGCVALITESAQAFVEDRTVRGIEEARESFRDALQFERLDRYHGDKARWVLDAWVDSWLHPEFAGWSLAPVLPMLRCPALVIHGEDDEYGSPAHPRLIAELAGSRVDLQILARTRHVPHRERPDEVLSLVSCFLESVA